MRNFGDQRFTGLLEAAPDAMVCVDGDGRITLVTAQAERERLRTEAERERLQRRIQQSQRLESLGQLAGGVAHDFFHEQGTRPVVPWPGVRPRT